MTATIIFGVFLCHHHKWCLVPLSTRNNQDTSPLSGPVLATSRWFQCSEFHSDNDAELVVNDHALPDHDAEPVATSILSQDQMQILYQRQVQVPYQTQTLCPLQLLEEALAVVVKDNTTPSLVREEGQEGSTPTEQRSVGGTGQA